METPYVTESKPIYTDSLTSESHDMAQTAVMGSMLGEYDTQLQDFANGLKATQQEQVTTRQDMQQVTNWTEIGSKHSMTLNGVEQQGYAFSDAQAIEAQNLAKQYGIPELASTKIDNNKGLQFFSKETLQTLKDAMATHLTDLNSKSEMGMMKFQSLMDGRKQALMMLTNMMNSDHQTKMAIAQNIK